MPNNRTITIRPGALYAPPPELDGWVMWSQIQDVGETITTPPPIEYNDEVTSMERPTITLADIEDMLGMSSTVDIINNIKNYIMSNLSCQDEDIKNVLSAKVDRIIEALGRANYTPTRRPYRVPPTHVVYLDDVSVEQFLKKLSKCSYIKWRLASPIYWGVNHIGFEGVFKR